MKNKTIIRKINGKKIVITKFIRGYYVSIYGCVYSFWSRGRNSKVDMNRIPKHLKPFYNKRTKYYQLILKKNNKLIKYKPHRIVCFCFYGKPPKGYTASHINGIRTDNRKINLLWESRSNNEKRKIQHGTDNKGIRNVDACFTQKQLNKIRLLIKIGEGTNKIAKIFNVRPSIISKIKNNHSYKYD